MLFCPQQHPAQAVNLCLGKCTKMIPFPSEEQMVSETLCHCVALEGGFRHAFKNSPLEIFL